MTHAAGVMMRVARLHLAAGAMQRACRVTGVALGITWYARRRSSRA